MNTVLPSQRLSLRYGNMAMPIDAYIQVYNKKPKQKKRKKDCGIQNWLKYSYVSAYTLVYPISTSKTEVMESLAFRFKRTYAMQHTIG